MDNQEQQQRKYGRCRACGQIGKFGEICNYRRCTEDGTCGRHVDPIKSIYPRDLTGLNITSTTPPNPFRGNCMGCYRQGIMKHTHRDCNQRIAYMRTVEDHVMDPCFLATYYRQFTNEPRDIDLSRLKPVRHDPVALDGTPLHHSVGWIPDEDYIQSTAATRGRNALVPQDPPYVESDESMQGEIEELEGPSNNEREGENADDLSIGENIQGDENSPNGQNNLEAHSNHNDDSDEEEEEEWRNQRPSYYDQPEPPVGSDEYILELIVKVVERSQYLLEDHGVESEPDDDATPSTPMEQRLFNEQMYIRLCEMAEGKIGYYDGMD